MNNVHLKPCPYCGGRPYLREIKNALPDFVYRVDCCYCWAGGPECGTAEEAAEGWNRRVKDDTISEMEMSLFDSAMETIRKTCRSYRICSHCPLFKTDENGRNYCRLETVNPADWILFSEEKEAKEAKEREVSHE